MKQASADQMRKNNEYLLVNNIIDVPSLKKKYLLSSPFKFGGKKRGQSNNGNVGRAHRRKKRNYLGGGPGAVIKH